MDILYSFFENGYLIERIHNLVGFSRSYSLSFYLIGVFIAFLFPHYLQCKQSDIIHFLRRDLNVFLPANKTDVLFCLLGAFGILNLSIVGMDFVVVFKKSLYNSHNLNGTQLINVKTVTLTLAGLLFQDLFIYLCHRIVHSSRWLWMFHAVHHSAAHISYFTNWRMHPLDFLWFRMSRVIGYGFFLQIIYILNIGGYFELIPLIVFYESIYACTAGLRHSSFAFRFPNWLSFIFLSPAMHLFHHSKDEKEGRKNFGQIFSIWDFLFGTAEVPQKSKTSSLIYGISGELSYYEKKNFLGLLYFPFLKLVKGIRRK